MAAADMDREHRVYEDAERAFRMGTEDHINALVADMNDPYYLRDPVEVDTIRMKKFHKAELVRQAVEHRVPTPVEKKALKTKYATLSRKKMKAILEEAHTLQAHQRNPSTRPPDHEADLERELAEMEAEINERNERLARRAQEEDSPSKDVQMYRNMGIASETGVDDDYMREPQPSSSQRQPQNQEGAKAMEFDEFFAMYGSDEDSEGESPYSRRAGKSTAMSLSKAKGRTRRGRTGAAAGAGMRPGSKDGVMTYQERHGTAGLADKMAASPVRNTSVKYLKARTKYKAERENELYQTVLDEATIMQQKFMQCIDEANLFSKKLGKGNFYKVLDRDPVEDAAWGAILGASMGGGLTSEARRKAKTAIPKGSGQRIAKMLVEVSHPHKDIRYLGSDHFFREHGRLQHEIQRSFAVVHTVQKIDEESKYDTSGAIGAPSDSSAQNQSPRKSTNKRSPRKSNRSSGSPSSPGDNQAVKTISPAEAAAAAAFAAQAAAEVARKKKEAKASGEKKEYLQMRKEIQDQLQAILLIIVGKNRNIQSQIDFIRSSGWNWLS